jgi:membrane associated rhomboid family serine protease
MLPVRDHLPARSTAVVNYLLIALNLAAFGLEAWSLSTGYDVEALSRRWALVPAQLVANPLANLPSLFTHMFLHGSLSHIGGNMLFLWIFGDNVEDALGHGRYALFYVLCGIAAAFTQVAASPHSTVPMLGASGAIAGVLAAYGLLYPRAPITIINPVPFLWLFWGFFLHVPAWFVILEFFGANLWNALQPSNPAGGVAFAAHVGGFIAGLLLQRWLRANAPVSHDRWNGVLATRRGRT